MCSADELLSKLSEIEKLIRGNTNQDGSCDFDTDRISVCLEITRRMFDGAGAHCKEIV
jgi:hypothetical protein